MPVNKVRERKTIAVDGFYDVECQDWTRFTLGGLIDNQNHFHWYDWNHLNDYIDHLLSLSGDVWGTNAGRYDTLLVASELARRDIRCVPFLGGQRIVRLKIPKQAGKSEELNICDMTALIPLRLEEAAKLGKYEKQDTGLPCICSKIKVNPITGEFHRGCGGYCSIKIGMPRKQVLRCVEYLEYDCLAGKSALESLVSFADEYDLDLASTIGRASWMTARRKLDLPDADWKNPRVSPSTLYKFARKGYYGGRTQVFIPKASHGWRYDKNSAYPHALVDCEFPSGERKEVFGRNARAAYRHGLPGVYLADVDVPECHIPPLPMRTRLRVVYPSGKFQGVWTALELQNAERLGAKIETIRHGIAWEEGEPIFRDYVQYIMDIRFKVGPKTPFGQYMKWYGNALSGKVAQKPETDSIVINPDVMPERCKGEAICNGRCSPHVGCCEHFCWNRCPKSLDPEQRIWLTPRYRLPDCGYVQHAAYLTAHARIDLLRQLIGDDDGKSAIYCDTDSVYALSPRHYNIGGELGQWKLEGEMDEWESLAPKTYGYINAWEMVDGQKVLSGEFVGRSKGVPDAAQNFGILAAGKPVPINRGVQTFKSAARGKAGDTETDLFRRKELHRQMRCDGYHFGDRILDGDLTRAQDARSFVE